MDSCPTELLSYVCHLACTDDGRTFRSLSLVSKYFNEVARPLRYQSLSVPSLDHISELVGRLQNTPSHLRRVRHLYVCTDRVGGALSPPSSVTSNAFQRFITLISPTLWTFAIVSPPYQAITSLIAQLFRTSFPKLHDLSIVGFYPFPTTPRGGTNFPRLQRLHLSGNRNPHGLLQVGCLDEVFPSLEHLRVSGLHLATSFLTELEEALVHLDSANDCVRRPDESFIEDSTADIPHERLSMFPSRLPPKIRRVEIQHCPSSPLKERHHVSRYDTEAAVLARVSAIAERGKDAFGNKGTRLVIRERMKEPGLALSDSAKREWLHRWLSWDDLKTVDAF